MSISLEPFIVIFPSSVIPVNVPTLVIAVCAAPVTVAAVPDVF